MSISNIKTFLKIKYRRMHTKNVPSKLMSYCLKAFKLRKRKKHF